MNFWDFRSWTRPKKKTVVTDMLQKPLEHLHIRQNALSTAISQQLTVAQRCAQTNNIQGAKLALQRKQIHERTLQHIQQQIIAIERQKLAIDDAETNAQTFNALKHSTSMIKKVNKKDRLSRDGVDDLMDTITEQLEDSTEIASSFGQSCSVLEVDVEDELNALLETSSEHSISTQQTTGVQEQSVLSQIPDVPTHVLPTQQQQPVCPSTDLQQLRQLENTLMKM